MKISVITVCFNSATTIRDTINSVLYQENVSVEYIIIDGGSTDGTMDIIREFDSAIDVVISEFDEGIYDAMNKGIHIATGDIVAILNSDDWYLGTNVLSQVEAAFGSEQYVDLVGFGVDFVRRRDLGKPVRVWRSVGFQGWMLFFGLMPPHPGIFVRRTVYDRYGTFVTDLRIAGDFEFLVRIFLKARLSYCSVNSIAVRMRLGGASSNGFKTLLLGTREMRSALEKNGFVYIYWLVWLRLPIKWLFQVIFLPVIRMWGRIV